MSSLVGYEGGMVQKVRFSDSNPVSETTMLLAWWWTSFSDGAWQERPRETHSTSWWVLHRPLGHTPLMVSMKVPGLPCEDTFYEQMAHCLALGHWGNSRVCGTYRAAQTGLQFSSDRGKSNRELDLARCLHLPVLLPGIGDRAMEDTPRIQYQRFFNVLTRTELFQDIILISFII